MSLGRRVRIRASVELMILEPAARSRTVARDHEGCAGVYCAVLVEGVIRKGDEIAVLDL